ncbi:hypothetical protein EUGRSUZ_J01608 [Eucalyptus grandis]|uniref:Uncharacterized protein n=2 Tax=Eucalyptus grandis TaxID=71139 RepID=A0A059AFJ5_EUCGR|nr:hypothetical protein EUGRSUZ_J01608 [Eucalyptus grandis]
MKNRSGAVGSKRGFLREKVGRAAREVSRRRGASAELEIACLGSQPRIGRLLHLLQPQGERVVSFLF